MAGQRIYLGNTLIDKVGFNGNYVSPTFIDADLQSFLDRTGITDTTIVSALTTLVSDLKTEGIWDLLDAIYPFVGGNATAHAQNLRYSSFYNLTFSGTWTHNSNGITGDGSSAYADTSWNPTSVAGGARNTDGHIGLYSRTDFNSTSGLMTDIGAGSFPAESLIAMANSGNTFWIWSNANANNPYGNTQGFYINNRRSTDTTGWKNGSLIKTVGTNTGHPNRSMYIGAQNTTSGADRYTTRNYAFGTLGKSVYDKQSEYYTIVQNFQTALSRNV